MTRMLCTIRSVVMRNVIHTSARLLNPAQRRFRAARPGSVLILVVALLVLLALIGTAWMSTVRIERYASSQNMANVQIDLLVEGAKNIAQAVIVDDLFGGGAFKPNDSSVPLTLATYGNFDWPTIDPAPTNPATPLPAGPYDRYIASRLPQKLSSGLVIWPTVSTIAGLGKF